MPEQIKSKQRVANHGEVFTAEREVNAMLDMVKQETDRVDSRFLEPACGDGNFLAEILSRKLNVAKRNAAPPKRKKPIPAEYEKQSVMAVASIYGVDLLQDNVDACRERLFKIWDKEYHAVCKKAVNEDCRNAVRYILSRNIICGNALTMMCVDENGNDTDKYVVFSEWSFVSGTKMQRKDYRFDKLLAGDYEPKVKESKKKKEKYNIKSKYEQLDSFSCIKGEKPNDEGELLDLFVADYRRIHKHG